jgi:O-antigen/teichoic acid export membrane protein
MTHALPSTVEPDGKFETRAAVGGPVGLWSQARAQWGQLSWLLAGKLALIGANAAVMLFLANHLALETYGLLVITISGQLLISRLLIMGVDAGMLRLTAVPDLRSRWQEVVNAGLVSMAGTGSVLIVVWILITPVLSLLAIPAWVVACIVAGAIGTSLVDYGYSFRLARQEYPWAALAQGGTALGRVLLTILAAMKFPANPVAVFVAYHGASLVSGLVQTVFVARVDQLPRRELIKRLLSYSFWLGKASVIVIFSLYQGTLLLMVLNQPEATGLFGLGLTLSLGFFAIYNAYSEYLQVRIRSVEHVDDVGRFTGRALAAALVLMLACVPVVFLVVMLMPWFVAPELLVVVPAFVYLSASMVLLILQAPLVATCHYLLKPHLITLAWVMRVVLIAAAGLILAPRMGATGAAVGQLIGSVLALLVFSWLVAGALRSTPGQTVKL